MIERTVQLTGADRSGDGERFSYSGSGLYFHRVDGGPLWLRLDDERMLIPVCTGRSVQIPFSHFWLVHAAGLSGTVQVLVLHDGELVADMVRLPVPVVRSIVGTNPAPGNEVYEVVPTNKIWRLLAVNLVLTTSAAAANRYLRATFTDPSSFLYVVPSPVAQIASQTRRYDIGGHGVLLDLGTLTSQILLPLPHRFMLKSGFAIQTTLIGIQAGDDWAAPVMLVEEWGVE